MTVHYFSTRHRIETTKAPIQFINNNACALMLIRVIYPKTIWIHSRLRYFVFYLENIFYNYDSTYNILTRWPFYTFSMKCPSIRIRFPNGECYLFTRLRFRLKFVEYIIALSLSTRQYQKLVKTEQNLVTVRVLLRDRLVDIPNPTRVQFRCAPWVWNSLRTKMHTTSSKSVYRKCFCVHT